MSFNSVPWFAVFTQATEKFEGSGTPAGAYFQFPHLRVRFALKRSALAYRRSTAALAAAT
jgi:hypothetical protein